MINYKWIKVNSFLSKYYFISVSLIQIINLLSVNTRRNLIGYKLILIPTMNDVELLQFLIEIFIRYKIRHYSNSITSRCGLN